MSFEGILFAFFSDKTAAAVCSGGGGDSGGDSGQRTGDGERSDGERVTAIMRAREGCLLLVVVVVVAMGAAAAAAAAAAAEGDVG